MTVTNKMRNARIAQPREVRRPVVLHPEPVPEDDPESLVVEVVEITPRTARDWLQLNSRNRPVTQTRVNLYAQRMREGRWRLNGESIKMTDTELLDGQHRLLAVLASGVTIKTVVVYGVSPDVFTTIDQGKVRSMADAIAVKGRKIYRRELGALATMVWAAEKNDDGLPRHTGRVIPPHEELIQIIEEDPQLQQSLESTGGLRQHLGATHTAVAYFHWLVTPIDEDARDRFLEALKTGVGEGIGMTDSPLHRLREVFILNLTRQRRKLDSVQQVAILIKGWNAWRQGKRTKLIGWKDGIEAFPIPQ